MGLRSRDWEENLADFAFAAILIAVTLLVANDISSRKQEGASMDIQDPARRNRIHAVKVFGKGTIESVTESVAAVCTSRDGFRTRGVEYDGGVLRLFMDVDDDAKLVPACVSTRTLEAPLIAGFTAADYAGSFLAEDGRRFFVYARQGP